MNDTLFRLYRSLPGPICSVAASLRGLYLRYWRYGPETERLIEEALEREYWSPEKWKIWREERLAYVLHRAVKRVPYYREQWAERRRRGDRSSWEYLENWPVLEKETLRQHPTAFVADDYNIRYMFHEHTSGTTGTPLSLWLSRKTVQAWYALLEARLRRWNGVSYRENWAILGGQPVVRPDAQYPPFWVWNGPMHQLYMSANHISRHNVPAYIAALNRYRVTHLITYSSSAAFLGREAIDLGLDTVGLKTIITNAEPLFPWQRSMISQGLGGEVRESYGMAEVVAAASECETGTLHLWPEVGWLEVMSDEDEVPLPYGHAGYFIATGLLNADMPLVRYAVGDRGQMAGEGITCKCGRTLAAISSLEGRANDLLIARDGRRIYWLNPIFYGLPVREAQIIQESLDRLRVRCVPAPDFTSDAECLIIQRLQQRMGTIEIFLELMNEIPRGSGSKFQPVICDVSEEEREYLQRTMR